MSPLPPQMLSPLDSRYRKSVEGLGEHLSEAALNRARVHVEVEWLLFLTDREMFGSHKIDADKAAALRALVTDFGQKDIDELAEVEARTRHDVKAVEYYVRARLEELGLSELAELTHFACTSEDINNLSYAVTIRDAVTDVWLPSASGLADRIAELAVELRDVPLLSLTHGQPATPTTLGKELAVFTHRLRRQLKRVEETSYLGKFAGATGNFAAHQAASVDTDWETLADEFVSGLGLTWNPLTTQIESHDWQAELYSDVSRFNRILHNFCTDVWTYISRGVFRQIPQAGSTGSSTMPHKINPIRFENAEANLEISSALLDSLASTLVTSRLQRDLTDSSAQRNIGVAFGHSLLALDNVTRGLREIAVDEELLANELDGNWEVLGEAIQTVIRAEIVAGRSSIADPYAVLKDLTRGRRIGKADLVEFVTGLDIGQEAKDSLLALTPGSYTGASSRLVDHLS
ncbi:adenylosuccinate lyase [Pseudoclavibacter sp. RFBJ3]|uniref:adenylosuccinate lyase n=1 Tax=unclassified Pseudoclavibacter TaxID=2615177 RepID=UPI000CE85CE0|nr:MULTISPECIES: adenylosuccinate lyase [unclassified Pseudoclavibacter]PPF81511.1 adenylosuccinate lyase [Pseudoclavibacter sp. RFBJ5]PPF90842.1 adenylosuccinate lyase [Pseudoclavibacter sp. RFBJ3]PPG00118.1 adenylosuccinate lyase [Pseudoclavibacter sp. RFBH5]PPG19975.1 adenylosuccinate lyase [Pseudoclavibacter sp. RFBI4]